MNRERFLDLIDILENKVTDKQFDIGTFYRESECGTVACAAGWLAIYHPEYFKPMAQFVMPAPIGRNIDPFEALAEYFDIDVSKSLDLFGSFSYITCTKDEVIKRIKNLLLSNL